MRRLLHWVAGVLVVSAYTVHQHSTQEHCLDLQCPATAFEYGIRNLVSEETLRSDKCQTCQQCTASGYSVCMRMSDSRGRRGSQTEGCSCTHSVPANCHTEPSRNPPNMTMSTFHICYLSALQAPPRAFAVNNKENVIVTVDPFWTEPYWRELQMENLTLHYEYAVQKPEHCEGDLITSMTNMGPEHHCADTVHLDMDGSTDGEAQKDEDYEHSDNYNEYDDSLPPEVVFDRDVFDSAKLLKAYYTVQVRRPRQLIPGSSDPFRDEVTLLDSEVLKFDLKPEVYGTGVPDLPPVAENTDEKNSTDSSLLLEEENENTSEEHGEGTNFFEEDTKDAKSEEEEEKEEEEMEKNIEDEEKMTTTEPTTTTNGEEATKEVEENKEVETTTEGKKSEEQEQDDQEEEEKKTIDSEEKDDDTETETEETTKPSEEEKTTTVDENDEDLDEVDKTTEKTKEPNDDGEEEEEGESSTEKSVTIFGYKLEKWPLARLIFAICFCSFLVILLLYFCRKCCCKSQEKTTTANGYRYNNPNRTDLVSPPEKERLHQ